jgi:hypothetical protein
VNLDVLLNSGTVPITSRTGDNPSVTPPNEAVVTIGYPAMDGTPVNIGGTYVSTNGGAFANDVRFTGVSITAPDPQITISGIRANVNPTYVPLNTGGFGQVLATISVSNGVLPITQVGNGFFVGIVLPGLGAVSVAPGITIQSCGGTISIPSGTVFSISVPENFPTAFKVQGPLLVNGVLQDSETGTVAGAPQADSATELAVTFNNIPSGVSFYIPATIYSSAGTGYYAQLVSGEASNTAIATSSLVAGSSVGLPTTDAGGFTAYYELVTGGTTYFYNFFSTNPSVQETYTIPTYPVGAVSSTTGTPSVSVVLAPQATTEPTLAPRFISLSSAASVPAITVVPCQTTLLFPYMTNQAGFDTGFSIAATSMDPFGTFAQGGTCTLNMYGANPPATAPTLTVPTGGEGHATVSSVAPNFQGYVIAVCNFEYAHGYAFLSNGFQGLGNGSLSEGYTANVIGNTRNNTPSTQVVNGSYGESLGH